MRTIIRLASLLFLACAPAAAFGAGSSGLERAAAAFYAVYRKTPPAGVPSGVDLARFRPVVSNSLYVLLESAGKAEQDYVRHSGGDSPPLAEGDLFTSLFEGASSFRVEECREEGKSGKCRIALTYVDPRDESKQQWRDALILVREKGDWRADDIEFGGNWEFMHKGSLRGVLENIVRESRSQD